MTKEKLKKRILFLKNRGPIERTIRSHIGKRGLVVHGAKAVNAQLPRFLNKPTKDYDVFTATPQKSAVRLEKKLDKLFRGDFFGVKRGSSKLVNVRKVFSKINDEGLVDFASAPRPVPIKVIQGLKFATLGDQKRQFKRNLTSPTAVFRREKDREALRRIAIFEKLRGRKVR